jgi:predicted protein tyrosine phosphatase
MNKKPNILFVCGKNQWRSPTAVTIYNNDPRINVRSAGVSSKSSHQVSKTDLEWADLILVMERKHKARLLSQLQIEAPIPPIESLEIPDDYEYMDEELQELIISGTESFILTHFKIEQTPSPRPSNT